MSFLSSVKKALGFPDEYDELDENTDDESTDEQPETSPVRPAVKASPVNAENKSADHTAEPSAAPTVPAGEVFDAVIELFNSTQPDFVRQCLDTEAQRAYIMEHISAALKARFEAESEAARRQGEMKWQAERAKKTDDLEKIKSEYHSLKQQREEFESARLSASRQKRALNDRIHDLESQVINLQAEKEQYQLENRSMLNKLRVAGVRANADPDTEAELQRLTSENLAMQDKLAEFSKNGETTGALTREIETIKAEAADLKAEAEKQQARIRELTEANGELTKTNSELSARLEESQSLEMTDEQKATIDEIEAQITRFDEIKKKKDRKINELTEQLKTLRSERETAKTECDRVEADLRAEIKRLTAMINAGDQPEPRPKSERKSNKNRHKSVEKKAQAKNNDAETEPHAVKISAIDELMESTDWFTAPEPIPLKKDPEVEESFGYKEPVKKTSRDEDKQLSLW